MKNVYNLINVKALLISIFLGVILVAIFYLAGCNNPSRMGDVPGVSGPVLTNEEINRIVLLDTSYVYPLENAKADANRIGAELSKIDNVQRSIDSVVVLPSLYSITGKTVIQTDFKISKPKTPSLYVINYINNNGFTIISADKRYPYYIGASGKGRVNKKIEMGLALYLENCVYFVDSKVAELELLRWDDSFKSLISKLESHITGKSKAELDEEKAKQLANGRAPECYGSSLYVPCQEPPRGCQELVSSIPITSSQATNTEVPPLLGNMNWGQREPYNRQVPNGNCTNTSDCGRSTNYLAGCVAISEALVSAYYLAKTDASWAAIKEKGNCGDFTATEIDKISALVKGVLDAYPSNLVNYGCSATGVRSSPECDYFCNRSPYGIRKYWPDHNWQWSKYDGNDVKALLRQSIPVSIGAFTHKKCFLGYCLAEGDGHQWVIDGLQIISNITTWQCTESYRGNACERRGYQDRTYTYTTSAILREDLNCNWGWYNSRFWTTDVFRPWAGHIGYDQFIYIAKPF